MPVFTNILIALDGSEASQRALSRAVDEAKIWNAQLQAIYVVETGLFSSLPPDNTVEIMYRVLEKEGEAVLEKAKKFGAAKGITIITHMKQGHAGSEIVVLAEQGKTDLIMVGSHGKSNTDRLLIGSVSTFVVTHSKATTMVVRS
ncbi:MAG: universal stress protein [Methanoregula sp.]|jgi:nucleotide-binding universal stress UspA family protein